MLVIARVVALSALQITQFSDQVSIWLISQLIQVISRILQKLFRYFNTIAISTSTVPPSTVIPVNLYLNINNLESAIFSSGSSLQHYHKRPDVFEYFLTMFYYIIHQHYNISNFGIISLCPTYLNYAVSKLSAVFKYYFFIVSTCCYCFHFCFLSNSSYDSFHKYVCITVVT